MNAPEFRNELERLINSASMENGSNTPDFILAEYLVACLAAFDHATRTRDAWYGHKSGGEQHPAHLTTREPDNLR